MRSALGGSHRVGIFAASVRLHVEQRPVKRARLHVATHAGLRMCSLPIMGENTAREGFAARGDLVSRLRAEGATLAEIGQKLGVTRERVRQILLEVGGPSAAEVERTKLRLRREVDLALRKRIVADTREHAPTTLNEAAERLGVSTHEIQRLASRDVARTYVPPPQSHSRGGWSREAIGKAIREAARRSPQLSTSKYRQWRQANPDAGPGPERIAQLFGSWQAACTYAGVDCGHTSNREYRSAWTDEDLLTAVAVYLSDRSTLGTFKGYAKWASKHKDRPSATTLRNRIGPWSVVKRATLERHLLT